MPQSQFIPSPLKIIERRRCQNCGATLIMTGIEPMGLGTDGAPSNAINAVMKKSCLSNSDKPPQSSLRPDGRLLCLGSSKPMTLPGISMCWRYAPCLFSLAWFCWEHSEFKRPTATPNQ